MFAAANDRFVVGCVLSHIVVDCIENVFLSPIPIGYVHLCRFIHSVSVLGVEIQCIGHFKLLFSLLSLNGCPKLQMLAVEVCF